MTAYTPSKATITSILKTLKNGNLCRYDKAFERLTVSSPHEDRIYKLRHQTIVWMQQQGLVKVDSDCLVALTREAANWVLRNTQNVEPMDGFKKQHQKLAQVEIVDPQGLSQCVSAVDPESPLAWLMARKDKSGVPFLSDAHYAAGERLRLDYGRADLSPQMGMNWCANGRQSSSVRSGVCDANDAALDARDRVNKALNAVGPELVGPLLDVCCYLRSLSDVEKSYNWPARSGKLILKLSLQALARHYGLLQEAQGHSYAAQIRHAGTAGYRPTI